MAVPERFQHQDTSPDLHQGVDPVTEKGRVLIDKTWRSLLSRLENILSSRDIAKLSEAFELAVMAHGGYPREDKQEFITHPIGAASELISHGIYSTNLLCAALDHDVVEGGHLYLLGDISDMTWDEIKSKAHKKIASERRLGKKIASLILAVTKPMGVDFQDREQARELYYKQIEDAGEQVIILKMPDVLHNLKTPYRQPKHRRKIKEVEEHYMSMFESATKHSKYGQGASEMLEEIKGIINESRRY